MKTLTLQIRKGLNKEIDSSIQPGGYKEIDLFEAIIDSEVVEMCEYDDNCWILMKEVKNRLDRELKFLR